MSRSCFTMRSLSSRSVMPAERTVVPSFVGRETWNGPVSPSTARVFRYTEATAALSPSMTSFTGSVRNVGKRSLKWSWATRVCCCGGR